MNIFVVQGDASYVAANYAKLCQRQSVNRIYLERSQYAGDLPLDIEFSFYDPMDEGIMTDFPHPAVSATIILSKAAADVLAPMLEKSGELLPLKNPTEMGFQLFVCYRYIDALNLEKSDYVQDNCSPGLLIRRHELKPALLEEADVFLLERSRRELFVSERFVEAVSRNNLLGLLIEPVWSSSSGGIDIVNPSDPFHDDPLWYLKPEINDRIRREKRRAMRGKIAELAAQKASGS